MQNRFTFKDAVYVTLGLLVCLLLFLNMIKTDREVESLDKVGQVLKQQSGTLSKLESSISGLTAGTLQIAPPTATTSAGAAPNSSTSVGARPREDFKENIATLPDYEPGAPIAISSASSSVNRQGLPQQWQTAPDSELPADFAPGDTVVQIWPSEPQTLTPFVSRDRYATDVYYEVLEPLVWNNLEPPYQYVPGLARSWDVGDDGLELTFHLFPNATWSDGRPVTADDVVFSFDLVFNEKIDAPVARSYLKDNIESYRALDSHTVQFRMKEVYFNSVGICGNLLWVLPKHIYGEYDPETYNTKIRDVCVGSGPWVLQSWEKGNQIVLVRNENYWGPKPALSRQVIRFIQNQLAGLQEFRAGNGDVLIDPTPEQWAENIDSDWLKERGYGLSYHTPLRGYAYIGYNHRLPFFRDKRTRRALTMLVNRREFIDTLRAGLGEVITGPFFFLTEQYDKTIEPWPYDPQRARELLREVGWEDTDGDGVIDMDLNGDGVREPFEVTFTLPVSAVAEKYQRYIQDRLKVGGIKLNLDILEWSVFEERLTERDFEMVMLSWTSTPEGDPFQIWHSSQAENRGSNYIGFISDESDRIIEQARRTLDHEKRMDLWHQFHQLIHEEQPYTFMYTTSPKLVFIDKRFRNAMRKGLRLYVSEWYVPASEQKR